MQFSLNARQKITNHIQGWSAIPQALLDDDDRYAALYTSNYLIADTAESIGYLTQSSFSANSHSAYLEFWGLMQAIIILQDSVEELYKATYNKALPMRPCNSAWLELRKLRNELAGHPANRSNGAKRSFLGRNFGALNAVKYEQYSKGVVSSPSINFSFLIKRFDREAALILLCIFRKISTLWP
jgi:hypothetical protein